MFIVDYTQDYLERNVEIKTFSDDSDIINWVAEQSHIKDFKIVRINKYTNGRLQAHMLKLSSGRLVIEHEPIQGREE